MAARREEVLRSSSIAEAAEVEASSGVTASVLIVTAVAVVANETGVR